MARKTGNGSKQSQNGVSGDGGNSEGAGGTSGDGIVSGGSGDGGGGDGSVIQPKLGSDRDGDGASGGDGSTAGGERRGRGRPRGSTGQKKAEVSVSTLAEVISFAHVALATVVKNDAWSLDDGESKRLADAASKVLKHYDTPAFSAQAMDWIGLIMVAGSIYGPRIMATRASSPRRPVPQAARTPQQPHEPVTEQGDGFVEISHPDGSGRMVRMPVAN